MTSSAHLLRNLKEETRKWKRADGSRGGRDEGPKRNEDKLNVKREKCRIMSKDWYGKVKGREKVKEIKQTTGKKERKIKQSIKTPKKRKD